jgi:predicted rRNA methylase YqxC with S4 and FtsJ domains
VARAASFASRNWRRAACDRIERAVREFGFETSLMDSPILGAEGNKEFLLHARH